jgi:fibronectin type 3 domain-containing protein
MRPLRPASLCSALVLAAGAVVGGGAPASAATAPPAFGYGTPAFVNSAAPSTLEPTYVVGTSQTGGLIRNDQDFAGEPSIGVNWNTGAALYQASSSTYKVTFDPNTTTAAGVHWANVSSPYSKINVDPILATDHLTGTTIAGGDDGACAVMSVTTTDGGTQADPTAWTPSAPCPFAADHPTVGMGPYAGTPPVNATAPFVTYFCQQQAVDECSHSVDGGLTWSPSVPDPNLTCVSLFGHVKVSNDGTAYIPSANCIDAAGNSVVGAITSTDNGQSLSGVTIPGAPTPADGFDPSVATDSGNRVYETWSRAGDYHPVVTWSDDHGQSWAPQVDLAPGLTAATFEAAVAGDSGRAAVAFLGTTAGAAGQDPFTAGFHGIWYLYVSYTYDGGAHWSTVQASPDPVQRGEIDAGGTTTSGQRNLLDFMDASLTKDGRVVVGYADGCLDTCNGPNGTEAQSQTDNYATVAYQTTGEGLFSAYDVVPVTAPAAPTLTAASAAGGVDLSWTAPADGGSAITGYQVLRSTSTGTESLLTTLPTGTTSYSDTATTSGTTYYYQVAAVNSIGVGDPSNEVSATPASAPAAPTASAADGNGKVALSWAAPADGGSAITGYQISRGLTPGGERPYASVGTVTSYADTAVTAGTTYYYTVTATNAVGASPPSAETSTVPTTVPSAPALTATGGKLQVTLSWSTPTNGGAPITGWAIYRATSSGTEALIQSISSGTSYVDNTVTGGTTYYYEVAAINRNGTGALSAEALATPKKGR